MLHREKNAAHRDSRNAPTLNHKNLYYNKLANLNGMNDFPKLNQDQINNLDRPIACRKIQAVIKRLRNKKLLKIITSHERKTNSNHMKVFS